MHRLCLSEVVSGRAPRSRRQSKGETGLAPSEGDGQKDDERRDSMKRCFLMILLLLPLLSAAEALKERPAHWAQPLINSTIQNLYKVDADVYRAHQPEVKDLADLKVLKIKTLLNLREYHKDDAIFRQNGINLMHHKLSAGSPTAADLIAVLKLLRDAEKPVLVHCWHGSDRTGFVVAGYRIVFQRWTREEAVSELRLGGFGYHQDVFPNIVQVLNELDVEAVRKSVLK
ncbi:MAG: protein tyrosine phosphatase [Deltaproteobacteria bacterium]|nr:protein tyrosine phosphatase [Deltaproteobacteria bacterium]